VTAVSADNTKHMQANMLTAGCMYVDFPVASSTVIYRNTFVGLNTTGYLTSYVTPAVYTGATATGTSLRGIACEHVASQSADGAKTCRVMVEGYFTYYFSGVAVTDVGCPVFASDNATIVADATAGGYIGQCVGRNKANYGVFKLNPLGIWAGNILTVVTPALDLCTSGQKILMVHETDNHNGLMLLNCCAYTVEIHACTGAQGVATIQHTADTTIGCTLTAVDNMADKDVIVGSGGAIFNPAAASDDAIVIVPAGKQVNADVTTQSDEAAVETGQIKIFATFMAM